MDKKSILFHVLLIEHRYHSGELKKDFLNSSVYDYHRKAIVEVKRKMRALLRSGNNEY